MKIKKYNDMNMSEVMNENLTYSSKSYKWSEDSISINYSISDTHKNIIIKLGNNENIFSRLTWKNFYKKEIWKELNLLPYLSDLTEMGLVERPYDRSNGELTKNGI